MGIGRVQARALIAAVKAGTNRTQFLIQVREGRDLLNAWIAQREAQDESVEKGFAESRPSQFDTYVASLPDIPVDQTP